MNKSYDTWWHEEELHQLAQLRRKQMSKETKIDWTKPIEIERYGTWRKARVLAIDVKHPTNRQILVAYYVPSDGTEYFARFGANGDNGMLWGIRNVQEPRYVWLNVYEKHNNPDNILFWHRDEYSAKHGKGNMTYLHTLKVNLDTGETEKLYL